VIARVKSERPDLLAQERKMVLDQALEYLYGWSEKMSQSNSEMALKLQDIFKQVASTEDQLISSR
jgi:hypothetical protein